MTVDGMCDCHSYNAGIGTTPEVVLRPREYFNWDSPGKDVCVDACIADAIRALWVAGIWTIGSCCGHNGLFGNASVIVHHSADPQAALDILQRVDPDRTWDVSRWKRITYNSENMKEEIDA